VTLLKIAIITPEYPPYMSGGVGSYNYELAKKLVEKGLGVIVIVPSDQRDELKVFSPRYKCYYLKTPSLRPRYFYFQLYNRERIRKILEREKIDIVQLNVGSSVLVKTSRDILRRAKIVLVFHGSPSPFNRLWDSLRHLDILDITWVTTSSVYSTIERALGDDVLKYADVAVHLAKHAMYYNILHNEKLRSLKNVVIYPGVDIARYAMYINSTGDYSTTKKFRSFVFSARLMRYKGVVQLLKAFSIASRKNGHATLYIFGDGPLKYYVLKVINSVNNPPRIFYYGKISRELFLEKLATKDILIHPSLYECFSMTVLEAALLNKPVIAHRAPWSEETVEATGIGITVDTLDTEKFAETLLDMTDEGNYEK